MPSLLARAVAVTALVGVAGSAGAAPRERGRVKFVTARRAYLDAGRLDGVKVGDSYDLLRNGKKAATCKVDQVADHAASCPADARVGDAFVLPPPPAPPAPAPPPKAATVAPVDAARAQAKLASESVEKVDFKPQRTQLSRGGLPLITASIGHTAFMTFGGSNFQQERIDFSLDGVSLRFGGFKAYAHLTALVYSQRPAEVRFRPGDVFQLYVWDLEASSREVGRPFVASVGRIWPHHAPGLTIVDGAQVGWRSRDGDAEVGVIGGTIPEAMTLYPSAHWLGGLYYGVTHASSSRRFFRVVRHEARLSIRDTVQAGAMLELEALLQAWVHKSLDIGAQARASLGAGSWTSPSFDAARASIGIHPTADVRAFVNFRYLNNRTTDPDALLPSLFSTGSWYYGDADLQWAIKKWITLSVHGGAAHRVDDTITLGRQYVGGEVSFPTLFRGVGGLSAGYREELGWIAGRSAWLGVTTNVVDRLRLIGRASYFEDRYAGANQLREVGLYLMLDGRLYRWLSLRASGLARVEVTPRADENAGTPAGLVARLELVGSW